MAVPAEVEQLAARIGDRTTRLHGLVHAAGLLTRRRVDAPDGTELTAAVHVLGPHWLTARLRPLLEAAEPAAVVWVSSGGMYSERLDVGVLEAPDPYRGAAVYARAKRAQVVLAAEWGRRLQPVGVACFAMHPGWVDTGALTEGLPAFAAFAKPLLRTPAQGADTIVWLLRGAAGAGAAPAFWLDRRARGVYRWPGTRGRPGEAARLWEWCEAGGGTGGVGQGVVA